MCGRGSQRGILTGTVPCALNSALPGDHCPAVGSASGTSWDLIITLTLPRTGTVPRNLSLPLSLILHLNRSLAWILTSALREITRLELLWPGDIPGPNPNPSYSSPLMGTQFQRRTASRAWGPEAVQADSARNLEAHHVFSQARLQLPRGLRTPPRPREEQHVWPWQPKRDPDRHRPLCPQLSPSGRPLPCCGFGDWNLQIGRAHV